MPAANPNLDDGSESAKVISPFASTTSTVQSKGGGGSGSIALWIVSSLLALVVASVLGYFVYKYIADPYRTLEPFPMDKYLTDYHGLTGAKFKADLKVSANIGFNDQVGRIIIFTVDKDSRPLPVLIPPKLGGIYFEKGQIYQASLEVQDGGTVYADTCEKE